jgi:hypothetical protein
MFRTICQNCKLLTSIKITLLAELARVLAFDESKQCLIAIIGQQHCNSQVPLQLNKGLKMKKLLVTTAILSLLSAQAFAQESATANAGNASSTATAGQAGASSSAAAGTSSGFLGSTAIAGMSTGALIAIGAAVAVVASASSDDGTTTTHSTTTHH